MLEPSKLARWIFSPHFKDCIFIVRVVYIVYPVYLAPVHV